MIPEKFLKAYNAQETEPRIYKEWEESGYFNPDNLPQERKEYFSMVLPPPNVTGTLHMGSALMLAIEDMFVRYKRMRGYKTLWIPGTDSAAIATQSVVEKNIQKSEGKSRHDLGREELLKRISLFVEDTKTYILTQIRSMGASLDWSRYAYTMDEARYEAVMEAFIRMYNAGLIYRGHRIVNWDPKGQTTISDDEIVYEEEHTTFYYFRYGPFTIGTARPETKFGDKYVVMHPDDPRYAQYTHGEKMTVEWINGPIETTVIKDEAIDMEFGTGVMTITPWHSPVDFEIAERHGLDKEQIIDEQGKLLSIAGEFAGMKIKDAREKIVEKLREKGLLEKEEAYTHNIATAERTGGMIEPQIKLQWFVAVNKPVMFPNGETMSLKEWMRSVVEEKKVEFITERYERIYYNWIDNLRDWCISRQIWFGHRIPVWYKDGDLLVQRHSPGEGWTQDEDVLDTWFSSGLWTFSTLGWPEKTDDLKMYHPTTLIETGYDILFFWIARMIMMSGFLLGEVPFKTVYMHGLVRDGQGRKISKSLGNNIDPLDMAQKYGMDAVRVALIAGMAPGTDSRISEEKIKGYKNFTNKIWNIARFVLENQSHTMNDETPVLTPEDEEDIRQLHLLSETVTKHFETYRVDLAFDALYQYAWHTFADVILEKSKPALKGEDSEARARTEWKLVYILETLLKLLHPCMPFLTEEIWKHMPKRKSLLMIQEWPLITKVE